MTKTLLCTEKKKNNFFQQVVLKVIHCAFTSRLRHMLTSPADVVANVSVFAPFLFKPLCKHCKQYLNSPYKCAHYLPVYSVSAHWQLHQQVTSATYTIVCSWTRTERPRRRTNCWIKSLVLFSVRTKVVLLLIIIFLNYWWHMNLFGNVFYAFLGEKIETNSSQLDRQMPPWFSSNTFFNIFEDNRITWRFRTTRVNYLW